MSVFLSFCLYISIHVHYVSISLSICTCTCMLLLVFLYVNEHVRVYFCKYLCICLCMVLLVCLSVNAHICFYQLSSNQYMLLHVSISLSVCTCSCKFLLVCLSVHAHACFYKSVCLNMPFGIYLAVLSHYCLIRPSLVMPISRWPKCFTKSHT